MNDYNTICLHFKKFSWQHWIFFKLVNLKLKLKTSLIIIRKKYFDCMNFAFLAQECLKFLYLPSEQFPKIQFLKKLSALSQNQKYKRHVLFLYCFYAILHKFDFVQALQSIQKAEKLQEKQYFLLAIEKLLKCVLYTHINKHKEALDLAKQVYALLKSTEKPLIQQKDYFKRMMPLAISNLNISTGKKSFFSFFNQVYDQLAVIRNENQLNEDVLFSIQGKIIQLKNITGMIVPLLKHSKSNENANLKSSKASQYQGFMKPQTKKQKALNNIQKMVLEKKQQSDFRTSKRKYQQGSNPYQLNLFVEEPPECGFM